MRVLDLFSGIGGFALGLERAGMRTVAFCECEPFPRAVLAERWPGVPCYEDVKTLTGARLQADGIAADLICGGFPCQDISPAGKGAGLAGERSGLFREIVRLGGEVRPRWIFLENVSALRSRGMEVVLGELAALGFDACWDCLPASALGAPHRRDRIWIVATNSDGQGQHDGAAHAEAGEPPEPLANAIGKRLAFWQGFRRHLQWELEAAQRGHRAFGQWAIEPPVGRVAHGVSARVDRLRALGNAVVPQIPEIFGRAILATEAEFGR